MQSFGKDKMEMDDMFIELKKWLQEIDDIQRENLRILQKLRGITITSRGGIQKLIGQLSIARELHMAGFGAHAPLDKDEISDFQKRIIAKYENLLEQEISMDLYELYNVCTSILTHSEKNLHNKWEDIFEMGEFIIEHYDVFREDVELEIEPPQAPEPQKEEEEPPTAVDQI